MSKETETGVNPRATTQQRIVYFCDQLDTWRSLATNKWSQHSFTFQCGLLILPAVWIVTTNELRATANILTPDSAQNSSQPKLQIVQKTEPPPVINPNQPEPNPQLSPPPETPQRIRVREIQVVGSTVFK